MGMTNENIELIGKTKQVVDGLLVKSSRRLVTRILVFFLFTGLIPAGYLLVVDYLQGVVYWQKKVQLRVSEITHNMYLMQSTISYLELCLNSEKADSANQDWYCETGVRLYKDQASRGSPVWMENILERNAIPAMLIEVEYQLNLAKDSIKKIQASKSSEELLLDAMLENYAKYLMILLIFLIAGYVLYKFKQGLHRSSE